MELRNEGWRIHVLPRGGGLAFCRFHDQEIMQTNRLDPFASGPAPDLCFYPLVPFANRIRDGRFTFQGHTLRLERNVLGHRHALHGQGWQAEWRVLESAAGSCTLRFEHDSNEEWPWRYRATETFAVVSNVLTIRLVLENRAASPMPAGIGFHPFFPRPASAWLRAHARGLSRAGALEFPRESRPIPSVLDFARARPIRSANGLDHCYSGWNGTATIEWVDARWRLRLEAAPLAFLHLYVPANRDFFCVEPVSHPLDAFNFAGTEQHAALGLEPGAALAATLVIRCEPADDSGQTSATPR
jgi:aldose 1-epimerase